MSAKPLVPPVALPPGPARHVRVEYLDFQDVGERREFRLRVCERDGAREFRFGIARAAFKAARVSLQDGPSVCYQKLRRMIEAGETASPEMITIDEAELIGYREAHTPVQKKRSPAPPSLPRPPFVPRGPARRPSPPPVAAAPVVSDSVPDLEAGQRVHHAIFGDGVTIASSVGRTAVCFDTAGTKTFVASMLEVEALSAPHTWETSRRGVNRPCRTVEPPAESPGDEVAPPTVE
jgi:hypothetical protein